MFNKGLHHHDGITQDFAWCAALQHGYFVTHE